jgi:lysophosphatidate acyltransferase
MPCSRYTSYILKHVTKVLGITWELRGGEYLAEDRGCVIVANHQSMLDILGENTFNFIPESLVNG